VSTLIAKINKRTMPRIFMGAPLPNSKMLI
jgi:hypothetical protein